MYTIYVYIYMYIYIYIYILYTYIPFSDPIIYAFYSDPGCPD